MSDVPPPPPPPPAEPPPPPAAGPPPSGSPDVGGAISWAFAAFGKNVGPMLGLAAVIVVAGLIGRLIQTALEPIFNRTLNNCQNITNDAELQACLNSGGGGFFGAVFGGLALQIIVFVITLIATIGLINASLKVTRGEKASFGDIWHPRHFWLYLFVSIVAGLGIGVGLVACIIPGLVLLWLWQFVQYAALDEGKGFGHAFSTGMRAVTRNKGLAIVTLLVVFVANLITVFTCGIGALVVMPFVCLFMANMYRQFLGQSVAPAN